MVEAHARRLDEELGGADGLDVVVRLAGAGADALPVGGIDLLGQEVAVGNLVEDGQARVQEVEDALLQELEVSALGRVDAGPRSARGVEEVLVEAPEDAQLALFVQPEPVDVGDVSRLLSRERQSRACAERVCWVRETRRVVDDSLDDGVARPASDDGGDGLVAGAGEAAGGVDEVLAVVVVAVLGAVEEEAVAGGPHDDGRGRDALVERGLHVGPEVEEGVADDGEVELGLPLAALDEGEALLHGLLARGYVEQRVELLGGAHGGELAALGVGLGEEDAVGALGGEPVVVLVIVATAGAVGAVVCAEGEAVLARQADEGGVDEAVVGEELEDAGVVGR